MIKERYQNPVIGDTVRLRLYMFNGNNPADVYSVDSVNIYICDETAVAMDNPHGKVLVESLDPSNVVRDNDGEYHIDVDINNPKYTINRYFDEWTVKVDSNQPSTNIVNEFRVYPQRWYSTPTPVVYDFSFDFQPNRLRKGSIQYIRIRVTPNVPRGTDLDKYYENLAITGDVLVSIEQKCGPCVPQEEDLRLVVDAEPVDYKEKCFGYYKLDTTEMDCGIYAVWFTLSLGGNVYVSDKMNLQIFE